MILGIGSDLCDIRRIERTLERFGERFLERVFTPEERRKAERRAAGLPPLPEPDVAVVRGPVAFGRGSS